MPSILLIEDDLPFRTMLVTALTESGYAVTVASDGEEGVKSFRANPTDLVITDIVMPNKDGTAAVAELRQEFPGLGIIAISGGFAHNAALYLQIANGFGADRTLKKPFKLQDLLQAIAEILAAKAPQQLS